MLTGDYEMLAVISQGGMARIHVARMVSPGGVTKLVAVKQLLPQLASDSGYVTMFLDEARLMARMSHKNVVQVFELRDDPSGYAVVMELVRGASARTMLAAAKSVATRIPYVTSATIIASACRGAHYAHVLAGADGSPLGIIHRDLNPANIMVSETGDAKLIDFGVARAATNEHKTRTATVKGTLAYMAPEQLEQRSNVDHRADVFSLGASLFELCTQKRPFAGDSELQLMMAIVSEPLPDPHAFMNDVPDALCAIMRRATAKAPAERYATAAEMADDLDAFIAASAEPANVATVLKHLVPDYAALYTDIASQVPPVRAAEPRRQRAPRRRTMQGIALVAVAAVLAFATWAMGVTKQAPPAADAQARATPADTPEPTIAPGTVVPAAGEPLVPTTESPPKRAVPSRERLAPRGRVARPPQPPRPAPAVVRENGSLAVFVKPFGEVFVDGRRVGLTPLDGPVELGEGPHTVRVFCERNGREHVETVRVSAHTTTRLNVDLR